MKKLADYEKLVKEKKCRWCEGELGPIEHYPHGAGWEVEGFDEKQWLYKKCLRCKYDWALWKIGVPR